MKIYKIVSFLFATTFLQADTVSQLQRENNIESTAQKFIKQYADASSDQFSSEFINVYNKIDFADRARFLGQLHSFLSENTKITPSWHTKKIIFGSVLLALSLLANSKRCSSSELEQITKFRQQANQIREERNAQLSLQPFKNCDAINNMYFEKLSAACKDIPINILGLGKYHDFFTNFTIISGTIGVATYLYSYYKQQKETKKFNAYKKNLEYLLGFIESNSLMESVC